MKNCKEQSSKISIRYTEDAQHWNKFVNFFISFMLESNVLEEYYERKKSGINR